MNITTARQAIKRHNTYVANAHQEENKKQMKHLKDIQATCPTTEIIAITSSNDLIRTVEKQRLFNGPGLQDEKELPENQSPATITVWKLTKNVPKIHGPAKADQTGMLDTARYTCWAEIHATDPPPDKAQEVDLLRKAKAWHTHTNLRDRETISTNTLHPPNSPHNAREQPPKRSQYQRPKPGSTNNETPPARPNSGTQGRPQHTRNPIQPTRYTQSNTLLTQFRLAPRPSTITNHLYTINDSAEIVRANEELSRFKTKNKAYQCLLQHRNHLIKIADVNSILTAKAHILNLSTIKVIGDGNCLQYAINASHKEQTNLYLANNDELRLLATALARTYTRLQTETPRDIVEEELKAIELTTRNSYYQYPGTYMHALASIRHGPIIVINDTPGKDPVTFLPLQEMTEILLRPLHTMNPIPQPPYYPPIYILNRTTVHPPHYDPHPDRTPGTHPRREPPPEEKEPQHAPTNPT